MSKLNYFGLLVLAAFIVPFAGCGGGSSVELVPVSGIVSIAGKPMEGVTVTLFGQSSDTSGEKRPIPYGQTDAEGRFTAKVSEAKSGAPAGQYIVMFERWTLADGSPIPEGEMPTNVDAINQIADIYNDPSTSPESATVPAGGTDSLNFDLKPKR